MPDTKRNIMQIWIMDSNWSLKDLNMILNEDVNFSICKWQRGIANFGEVLRGFGHEGVESRLAARTREELSRNHNHTQQKT